MTDKFNPEEWAIKDYENWQLQLHSGGQYPHIGRCCAWALRDDATDIFSINRDEREELHEIVVPEWGEVRRILFGDFWPNAMVFGNKDRHLHYHLVPRDFSVVVYGGITFEDPDPYGGYSSKKY